MPTLSQRMRFAETLGLNHRSPCFNRVVDLFRAHHKPNIDQMCLNLGQCRPIFRGIFQVSVALCR